MRFEGEKVYLTIYEQLTTGYSSPIDLPSFPLHQERETADTQVDYFSELAAADHSELSSEERATAAPNLEKAKAKSEVIREIAKEVGKRAAAGSLVNEITQFLNEN